MLYKYSQDVVSLRLPRQMHTSYTDEEDIISSNSSLFSSSGFFFVCVVFFVQSKLRSFRSRQQTNRLPLWFVNGLAGRSSTWVLFAELLRLGAKDGFRSLPSILNSIFGVWKSTKFNTKDLTSKSEKEEKILLGLHKTRCCSEGSWDQLCWKTFSNAISGPAGSSLGDYGSIALSAQEPIRDSGEGTGLIMPSSPKTQKLLDDFNLLHSAQVPINEVVKGLE